MLVGENIILRPERKSDVEYFVEWYNDFEVMQYLDMYLPMTEREWTKLIEEFSIDRAGIEALFVIEMIDGDSFRPIGTVGLHNINSVDSNAMFGIDIGEKDCWSKGYGTEAGQLIIRYGFEQLNLHRIRSEVFSFNERSIRLHNRLGFAREGCRQESVYVNGKYHNEIYFGLLREEWAERKLPVNG